MLIDTCMHTCILERDDLVGGGFGMFLSTWGTLWKSVTCSKCTELIIELRDK